MNLPDIIETVRRALAEDIGTGDVTTLFTVPEGVQASAVMVAKTAGTVAGLPVAVEVYRQVDPNVSVTATGCGGCDHCARRFAVPDRR